MLLSYFSNLTVFESHSEDMISKLNAEIIKVGVVTIDMLSIGTKFENFLQAGCRLRTVYCGKPIIQPKLVLLFGTFLELPVLPSTICDSITIPYHIKTHIRN